MSENENKKVIYQKSVGISALPYVFAAVLLPALIVYIGEKVINQELGDINRILIGTAVILLLGGVVTFIAYKKLNSIIQLVINMLLGSYLRIREGDLTTQFTMKENRLFTSQIDPSKHYTHQNEIQNITRAFSDMTHNFKDMVSRIQEQTNSVFRMSSELTEIAKQTNKSTEEVSQTIVSIAEEVRKLAEQSTIASNDISEIIEIVQEKSKEMVDNVRQTSENGATQSEAIKETLSSAKIVSDQVILVTSEISETIKLTDEMKGKKDFLLNSTKEILLVAEMNVISHQLKEKTDLFITQDNKEATLKIIEKIEEIKRRTSAQLKFFFLWFSRRRIV